ncbi:MAG: SDR family NAD(P)-dependent oxidoreductase [Polynucleobacter sp.]|nr:SDR family NAD(P)-dependent oxidoreductase [Polynucleobacter sp.]
MSIKKVAIVTGAAQGIGAGIVKEMLNDSYLVYAVDKNQIQQQENLFFHQADLSIIDTIPGIVSGCIEKYGRIDVLVNNAAVSKGKDFLETDLQTWELSVAVNQTAPFF